MIIGLVGFIGSGKGTVADILTNKYGYIKESYANSVKDATAAIFGWDRALLEGDTSESRLWREQDDEFWTRKFGKPFSPRHALQLMGTEAGRDVFHKDIWVHTVERRCTPNNNYVIADVRFPNEIASIHEMGGIIVRVYRGKDPDWYELAQKINYLRIDYDNEARHIPVHYSEWAWIGSQIDFTIGNEGSIEELTEKVDLLVDFAYNKCSTIERG